MATNTAASFTTPTGNGNTDSNGKSDAFPIGFSYLSQSEIDVTVGTDTTPKTLGTHYEFSDASHIKFLSGHVPANGVAIKFQRDTDISAKKVDFQDGSVLTESDLDTQNDQILFGLQEFTDVVNNDAFLRNGSKTLTGSVVFEGSSDDDNETTLSVTNPTADRTITLPDTTGTVVTTGDTGTVSNTMLANNSVNSSKIADGSIVNADINASAAIAGTKISPDFGSQPIATTGTVSTGQGVFSTNTENQVIIKDKDTSDTNNSRTGIVFQTSNGALQSKLGSFGSGNDDFLLDNRVDNAEIKLRTSQSGSISTKLTIKNAGVDVVGNLGVTGTVDGRDISADGTKLDGIEANAINASNAAITNKLPLAGGTLTGNVSLDGNKSTTYNPDVTGGGLVINHNGTGGQIKNLTGNTKVSCANGNLIKLNNTDGDKLFAQFGGATDANNNDSHVDLYFNNQRKATTAEDGLQVIGKLRAGFEGTLPTLNDTTRAVFSNNLNTTNATSGISIFCKGNGNSRINFGNEETEERSQIKYNTTFNRLDFFVRDLTNSTVANQTLNTQLRLNASSVELNYAGAKKAETSATGFDITGNLTTTGNIDSTGTLTITSNSPDILFAENNYTPNYRIKANSSELKIIGEFTSGSGTTLDDKVTISPQTVTVHKNLTVSGDLTATTQSTSDDSTKVATTAFAKALITNTGVNTKLPLAGGTLTGNLSISHNTPRLFFVDTNTTDPDGNTDNNLPNYVVSTFNGLFKISETQFGDDTAEGVDRIVIKRTDTSPEGSAASYEREIKIFDDLTIQRATPSILFNDNNTSSDYRIRGNDNELMIHDLSVSDLNVAIWNSSTSYSALNKVRSNSKVYQAQASVTGGTAPSHTSGTVNNWKYISDVTFDARLKILANGDVKIFKDLTLGDTSNILLGSDADLDISHNGAVGKIINNTGNFNIQGNAVRLMNKVGNEFYLTGTANAATTVYYDGSIAAQTSNVGLNVVGGSTGTTFKLKNSANDTDLVKIFHSGASTGNTLITSEIGDIKIQPNEDGSQVRLFENSSGSANQRLVTTSNGITVNGTVTESSDVALKENIQPLSNVLEKVKQLTGYKYNFKNTTNNSMGVIAQDVEKVFPELVHGEEGEKSLQYSGLIGALIESVKELSAKVAALENQ